jgi:hypothetical protein
VESGTQETDITGRVTAGGVLDGTPPEIRE